MLQTIYLDMDGVLVDWVGGVLSSFGRNPFDQLDLNQHDLFEFFGLPQQVFWNEIASDPAWWAALRPYPWYKELYQLASRYANEVVICTSPGRCPASPHGKMLWLKEFLGIEGDKVILTSQKYRLAYQPGTVLIDDSESVLTAWAEVARKRPGQYTWKISFPQPWNRSYSFVQRRMEYTQMQLHVHAKRK